MRFNDMSRVEQRLELLTAPERLSVTVSEACVLFDVSRSTFYEWRTRYGLEGVAGLGNRSTAPRVSPGRIPEGLESMIVEMRKSHRRWGPKRIRAELLRAGVVPPACSTIGQVLVRNGLVGEPPLPPPLPLIRFERGRVNELWQTDAKETRLADETKVHIISVIDDRSRYCPHLQAFPELTADAAIEVFDRSVENTGLPEAVLADRGVIFTGRTYGAVSPFERHLWTLGVYTINGRPYHPQTQGKVERFHRTINEWLQDNGPYTSIEELNEGLAVFVDDYNHHRPHQSLNDQTPGEVWETVEKTGPDPALAEERCRRETIRPTNNTGNITYASWVIGLGRRWARTKVKIVDLGHTIQVWSPDGEHIRDAIPDPTRRYLRQDQ